MNVLFAGVHESGFGPSLHFTLPPATVAFGAKRKYIPVVRSYFTA
jgi:hypothetical protein